MAGDKTITYDTSGSDTVSGCGPATAVTGTSAYSGDGAGGGTQTVIDLSGDSPDLSGILVDDILWINTKARAQRHLFAITAVDNTAKTVTVANAPQTAISSGDARSWAIGGTRGAIFTDYNTGTYDHVNDYYSWEEGWTCIFKAGQTFSDAADNQYTTAANGDYTNGRLVLKSDTEGSQATLNFTRNNGVVQTYNGGLAYCLLQDLRFNFSSSIEGTCGTGSCTHAVRCHFHHTGGNLYTHRYGNSRFFSECRFSGWSSVPAGSDNPAGFYNCIFDGCGAHLNYNSSRPFSFFFHGCVFLNAPASAIYQPQIVRATTTNCTLSVVNCTFYNSTDDDIRIADNWDATNTNQRYPYIIQNNISKDCGGYFVNDQSSGGSKVLHDIEDHQPYGAGNFFISNNLVYNATSGDYSNTSFTGYRDVTGDPLFVSETSGSEDFSLSSGSPAIDAGLEAPDVN